MPDAAPQTQAPDDYQHLTPVAAEGGEALGAGLSQAAQFYDQAAADDQTNKTIGSMTDLLYGTGKPIQQADGTTAPDTGFFGLKGAAAMSAAPTVQSKMQDLFQGGANNLQTPRSKEQYDNFTRRYRISVSGDIGRFTDQQNQTWAQSVNADSVNVALRGLAVNPNDPTTVHQATADILNATMKSAQLRGATPGDPVSQDMAAGALQQIAITRINAIGATDPVAAVDMIKQERAILGPRVSSDGSVTGDTYGQLLSQYQTKADQHIGENFVTGYNQTAIPAAKAAYADSPSNPTNPVYTQVSGSLSGGMSSGGLARLVQVESGGKDVTNKFGYTGYAQFGKSEWATYGAGGDPHNFADSVAAAQRYAIANARILTPVLGRQPTDAELYLAHQQGAAGATKLLAIPNAPAAQAIGYSAVYNNLPTSMRSQAGSITSQQFVAYWTHKFNGTSPANVVGPSQGSPQPSARSELNPASAPWDQSATGSLPTNQPVPLAPLAPQGVVPSDDQASDNGSPSAEAAPPTAIAATGAPASPTPLASVYQAIQNDPNMTDQQKQYAFASAERQAREQALADDTSAAQIKAQSAAAQNKYVSAIMQGQMPTMAQVAQDPNLDADAKKSISDFMVAHADESVAGASQAYGPGYWPMYQQVLADAGDPSRINDPSAILKAAGPGGQITGLGAQKLLGVLGARNKPDEAAIDDSKKSLIAYAKSKLSFQQDPTMMAAGVPPLKDPQGEQLFNAQFIPRFEAAFQQAKDKGLPMFGKNGFLNQDNVDAIADSIRNPREMALAKLEAQNGVDASAPILAPPTGSDPTAWQDVLSIPAISKGGNPWPAQNWAAAVHRLWENPTPEVQQAFDAHFSNAPFDAAQLLDMLKPSGVSDDQIKATRQMDAGEAKQQDIGPDVAAEEALRTTAAPNPDASAGHVR